MPAIPHDNDTRARRRGVVLFAFAAIGILLFARAVHIQVFAHEFYRGQGSARHERLVSIPAHRGMLLDRNGEPLAVSTPIQTLWGEPSKLVESKESLRELAKLLEIDGDALIQRVERAASQGREFTYVKRHLSPDEVEKASSLDLAGLGFQREYRRYYPSGPVAAHVIGFTDIDDVGREGLEMAYDEWLRGTAGTRRVVRDMKGREIAGAGTLRSAEPGKDLELSIDKNLQYFADRALREAVRRHQAESANLVVMDVHTGEVLAMANYPTYNPNDTDDRVGDRQRNRSITDVFEPGSTLKPFTIAAALQSGDFVSDDIVYTSPGYDQIGRYKISDTTDHGWLDLRGIIVKSSNVGVSKIARQLDPVAMWGVFDALGFGRPTGSEFPGEVAGYFNHPTLWHHVEQASVSFGYGISVTALQLARAYCAIANEGVLPSVTFVRTEDAEHGQQILKPAVANAVSDMLVSAVEEGTGKPASIPGYTVAGKTGTSHRSQAGGYAEDRYVSLFAGFAPASDPRFVTVVVVHDPAAGEHFGSQVAAPVFADVMSQALRLFGVEPDDLSVLKKPVDAGERS